MFDLRTLLELPMYHFKGGTVQGVVGGGVSHVVMAGGNTGKINKPVKVSGLGSIVVS